VLLGLSIACGKGATSASPAAARDAGASDALAVDGALEAEDPRAADLWTRAAEGEADDLARLAAYVGSDALALASPIPARRLTALRALAFSGDFTALPFLAKVATSGGDEDASAALDTVTALVAEPRRATDPEDAPEIHEGCALLLVLAVDPTRPAARRARAVSVLRMLASRGWVSLAEVPTDLDAR